VGLLQALTAETRGPEVIVCSDQTDERLFDWLRELGAVQVLPKPLDLGLLRPASGDRDRARSGLSRSPPLSAAALPRYGRTGTKWPVPGISTGRFVQSEGYVGRRQLRGEAAASVAATSSNDCWLSSRAMKASSYFHMNITQPATPSVRPQSLTWVAVIRQLGL
jgi:hypothetical protein